MFRSLRARLLLWYTAVLALVVVAFGGTVCYLAWRTRLADVDVQLTARATELAAALSPTSLGTFDLVLPPAAPVEPDEPLYHAIWDAVGEPVDLSEPDLGLVAPPPPGARTIADRREVALRGPGGSTVLAGRSVAREWAEIWTLAGTMLGVGAAALALALAGGWWVVGRALEPVDRISRTARAMVQGDFGARIPVERLETELELLAHALNEAFDRLHQSLDRQRRFTADASHELRTPLAVMSVELEWALGREREAAEYRQSLAACQRAAGRMRSVVERLLLLARAESEAASEVRKPVGLDALVRQVANDLRPLARERGIQVAVESSPVWVAGLADRLTAAITNLVVNAIQYNVDGGAVRLSVTRTAGAAALDVADTGVGIAPEHRARVFDPFFRADPARARGGAGLGLAVTQAIVRQHDGTIELESEPGRGTTVRVRLPAASAQPVSPSEAREMAG
jgi:signal transduction histidine kinase